MVNNFEEITTIEGDVERLIILRKRLGKSQYQFSNDIGVSSSYLGQIENYKFPFTIQLKEKINKYLRQERAVDERDLFSSFK